MCVTSRPAAISRTSVFTLVTDEIRGGQPLHVTGYQNQVTNMSKTPNCMFLHFPCTDDIQLVDGPQLTTNLMSHITGSLPAVVDFPRTRGFRGLDPKPVLKYGDYDVVVADDPGKILAAIEGVAQNRRPVVDDAFEHMVNWYWSRFPDYSFVLACFSGTVNPTHPIVVSYVPHSDDVVFAPGLDSHNGRLPVIGQLTTRDFRVAFGKSGVKLPINVRGLVGDWWAPQTVTGFYDNRSEGANKDYVLAIDDLGVGQPGADLLRYCF